MNIFDLPNEILIDIFQLFDPFEVQKLALLSQNSKKLLEEVMLPVLYRKQFGEHYRNDYRQRVIKSVFKQANELEIAWGNNSAHWLIEENDDCYSNYTATLRGVWWFHIAGKFENVWPREYFPNVRIKANNAFRHQTEFIQLQVCLDNEEIYSIKLNSLLDVYGDWVVIRLPSVNVCKFQQTITVIIHDTDTSRYNHGITIDYISLYTSKNENGGQSASKGQGLETFQSGGLIEAAMRILGL